MRRCSLPAAGTVAFAGRVAGRGVVSVDHPGGLRTTYEPVAARVSRGDGSRRGTVAGPARAAAPSHCLPATCLHWGLRRARPTSTRWPCWAGPVRLLPVWPRSGVAGGLLGPGWPCIAGR